MADSIRVVTFQSGGQITLLGEIQSSADFTVLNQGLIRDTLAIMKGDRNQQMVSRGGRYDGETYGGEKVSNSTYKFQILQNASTPDALLAKMGALFALTERVPGPHYIEHKNDGVTFPSYYEIRAPAKWQDNRSWSEQKGGLVVTIDVEWPVAPLACGAPMDVTDTSVATNLTDYTFDALAAATFPTSAGALTTERRIIHTVRGYKQGSCQVTVRATAVTVTGYKLGAIPKRTAANTYIDCYVDDDGTNSRLRIDVLVAGVRTNRFTTNLASRLPSGSNRYVRGRIEDSVVYAEYIQSLDSMGTPTTSGSYTLLTTELAALGVNVQGQAGYDWIPQDAAATVPTVEILPYTYKNKVLPGNWTLDGDIPGTAASQARLDIATQGPGSQPIFGLLGWTPRVGNTSSVVFGAVEAESLALGVGFAVQIDPAVSRGGQLAQVAATLGTTYTATFASPIDATKIAADDATPDQQMLEVWARVKTSTAFAGAIRVLLPNRIGTVEYGATGKTVVPLSSGTGYRMVRLGIVSMSTAGFYNLTCEVACTASGTFGLDYLFFVPASRRALTPTGKSITAYPSFVPTSNLTRQFKTNLQGVENGARGNGLGGSAIELPAGSVDVGLLLSTMVPDSPDTTAADTAAAHTGIVHFSITPRYLHQRSE